MGRRTKTPPEPTPAPSVASCAMALQSLGEQLLAADDHPDFAARLTLVEQLAEQVGVRIGQLRDVIRDEYRAAAGA